MVIFCPKRKKCRNDQYSAGEGRCYAQSYPQILWINQPLFGPRGPTTCPAGPTRARLRALFISSGHCHESGYTSRLQRDHRELQLRQHVQNALHHGQGSAGRRLLELPSFLYRQAENGRHRGPRRQVSQEVRRRSSRSALIEVCFPRWPPPGIVALKSRQS